MSNICRLSKTYCLAFFLLHALLHLEPECADYQFCATGWKDTPGTGLHSCLYSSKQHLCGAQEQKAICLLDSSRYKWLILQDTLVLCVPELPCLAWLSPIPFLFAYQRVDFSRIAGRAQRLLSKAGERLLCTCTQLTNCLLPPLNKAVSTLHLLELLYQLLYIHTTSEGTAEQKQSPFF